jgi:hypothetical protein
MRAARLSHRKNLLHPGITLLVVGTLYQWLLARGKSQKVALMAAMRRLLAMLNAMVKTPSP